ncbi:RICIN domain-containing protein [Actinoplanes sp. GCM10030250]|uniref:RICIN domain-containing protein n=1 Tax=Actinoplanes sp. GCM10030250 TaxID=3273376 RepID=UPI00360A3ED7
MKSRIYAVAGVVTIAVSTVLVPAGPAQAVATPAKGIQLRLAHSGKCLNVSGGSTANNAAIIQYGCNAAATNDKFELVPRGSGNYWIRGVGSGRCLNVYDNSAANNAAIIQYTCNAQLNGLWKVDEVLDQPTVRFVAASSGKCLNLPNGKTENNVALIQYTCSNLENSDNEEFYLPPAESPVTFHQRFTSKQPVSVQQGAPPAGGGVAPVQYSYIKSDNHLQIITDRNPDPYNDDPNAPEPVIVETYNFGYTGRTSSARLADGRVQTVVHDAAAGDTVILDETEKGTGVYGDIWDIGGASETDSQPITGPLTPDGRLATWAIVRGQLWYAPQNLNNPQTPYGAWRNLGGSGLYGTPVVVRSRTGARAFAVNTDGRLQTAAFDNGVLSDWSDLGGNLSILPPSVVVNPGYRVTLFARDFGGAVLTKKENSDGSWTGWTEIPGIQSAGVPSAVVEWAPLRTAVTVRGVDNLIYVAFETGIGTGAYGEWFQVSDPEADPETVAASDPTAFRYEVPSGESFGIAFRSAAIDGPVAYTFAPVAPDAAKAKGAAPNWRRHELDTADSKIRLK